MLGMLGEIMPHTRALTSKKTHEPIQHAPDPARSQQPSACCGGVVSRDRPASDNFFGKTFLW